MKRVQTLRVMQQAYSLKAGNAVILRGEQRRRFIRIKRLFLYYLKLRQVQDCLSIAYSLLKIRREKQHWS